MADPITAALIATTVISAGTAAYGAVNANQQAQHAKGAAQAEQQRMDEQTATAQKTTDANKTNQANAGSATQTAALQALRAAMSASSTMGGSIQTTPQGAAIAPTQTKTLLGL